MSSAALFPAAGAAVRPMSTSAAFLGWPSNGALQLQIKMSHPTGLGSHSAMYGAGAPIKRRSGRRVVHRDDFQAGPSSVAEQVKIVSSVEEMISGLEKEVGTVAGVEPTMQTVEKVITGLEKEVVANLNGATKVQQKVARRKNARTIYLLAAIASSTGFASLSAAAVVYRFWTQIPPNGSIPYGEVFGTFSLAVGAAVGMEYWARWAHKALWHASLWHMHESHHRPRDGPFELNDVFAIINAVPAISLMLYGFLNPGLVPAVCFGAGLGITMFGIAYMFVHDGLVHRRFPVGPIAEVPYFQKVAAAHQLHHADLYDGVPYGLFLGPKELEKVGGAAELEKWLSKQRAKAAAVASIGKDE